MTSHAQYHEMQRHIERLMDGGYYEDLTICKNYQECYKINVQGRWITHSGLSERVQVSLDEGLCPSCNRDKGGKE